MIQKLQLNPAQQTGVILQAKNKVDIWGRGTGKSAGIAWDINLINRSMPRALTSVTGQTFGQLLTRTLPSTFKLLDTSNTFQQKIPVITLSIAVLPITLSRPMKKS